MPKTTDTVIQYTGIVLMFVGIFIMFGRRNPITGTAGGLLTGIGLGVAIRVFIVVSCLSQITKIGLRK